MSRKWWTVLIVAVTVIGLFAAIKLMPYWATLVALGSFVFGCFSGYILKKKEIIEKIVEKPVEVIKEVKVPVEVIKEVIKEVPVYPVYPVPETVSAPTEVISEESKDAPVEAKPKPKKKSKNKKVAE